MTQPARKPRQVPPRGQIPPVPQWSPADFIVYRNELATHTPDINAALNRGLQNLLVDSDWYWTGLKVSLESMNAFCAISEIVYRDFAAHSEGNWHLTHLKRVTRKMAELSIERQSPATRARIMLEIRPSLAIVLRAFEGSTEVAGKGRKTMLAQLASDINFNLLRARSFRKMNDALTGILATRTFPFKGKRMQLIETFHQGNRAFAPFLGYDEPGELLDNGPVKTALARVTAERKKLRYKMRLVRDAIYSHTAIDYSQSDPEDDLAETNIVPILTRISSDGFDFLSRAGSLYEHALMQNRNGLQWLQRLSHLESRFYEHELMKIVR